MSLKRESISSDQSPSLIDSASPNTPYFRSMKPTRKKQRSTHPKVFFKESQLLRKNSRTRSCWEVNLAEELKAKYSINPNDRKILRPYEIDIICTPLRSEPYLTESFIEVNGPVHFTPRVFGLRGHLRSLRNDLRKLKKAQLAGIKLLIIPAPSHMPGMEEVHAGLELCKMASGSFSLLHKRLGKPPVPLW